MKIAAVTVHFKNPDQTGSLIRQLHSSKTISTIIVVLHDDLPGKEELPAVHYLASENRGYGAGLNLAFRRLVQTSPELQLVLALNPDVQINDVQVDRLVQEHTKSDADCTFPSIREGKHLIRGYRFTNLGAMQPVETGARFFPGTCFLLSTAAWQKAEGFNEEYFHYYEDVDFCLRLQEAGCRIHHAASVCVEHVGKSGADFPATSLPRYAVRNHLLFLRRLGKFNALSFLNVSARHFFYLFRWKHGWRGAGEWLRGIREFLHRKNP